MEHIKEAVSKARAAVEGRQAGKASDRSPALDQVAARVAPAPPSVWQPPLAELDRLHLDRHRIVAFAATDPGHVGFNLLRTKAFKLLQDSGWKGVALTSPTARCGKTMVAVNLAFSLARQPACKTVLIDLDLRRSAIARTVGVSTRKSVGQYLEGKAEFEDCFVQVGDNLVLGLNLHSMRNSAELMHDQRLQALLRKVNDKLDPDVMLFDLPPMLANDDALAFLPNVDSALLVIAAGKTTAAEVEECERQVVAVTNFLGVVLNKAHDISDEYHHYSR